MITAQELRERALKVRESKAEDLILVMAEMGNFQINIAKDEISKARVEELKSLGYELIEEDFWWQIKW